MMRKFVLVCVSFAMGVFARIVYGSNIDDVISAKVGVFQLGVSIEEFGAKGDGETLNTSSIQRAIDWVSERGGGGIIIPPGRFRTGMIELKRGVILYLLPGSVLVGSRSLEDYPERIVSYRSYTDNYTQRALIFAEGQEDIGIVGWGEIFGSGESFPEDTSRIYKARPNLIRFVQCKNVRLEGVRLKNGAMWTVHFLACEQVVCSSIYIHSRCNSNNDGIDIDSCENVVVSDCHIVSGDDSIVLKSTSPKPCKNVAITNCILSSWCNAIKMGTESNGGFQNITISNCVLYDTRLSGLAIETVDGGVTEDIAISNITMRDVACPIFVRLGNRARPCCPDVPVTGVGRMRNIIITNITATGADSIGCPISGIPGHSIENLNISNVSISMRGGIKQEIGIPAEKEEAYPEHTMFGTLPASGFFVRHVKDLFMHNIRIHLLEEDIRPVLFFHKVENPYVEGVYVRDCVAEKVPVKMEDVQNSVIKEVFFNGSEIGH